MILIITYFQKVSSYLSAIGRGQQKFGKGSFKQPICWCCCLCCCCYCCCCSCRCWCSKKKESEAELIWGLNVKSHSLQITEKWTPSMTITIVFSFSLSLSLSLSHTHTHTHTHTRTHTRTHILRQTWRHSKYEIFSTTRRRQRRLFRKS